MTRKSLTGQDGQANESVGSQDTERRKSTDSKRERESKTKSVVRVEVHRDAVMANDDDDYDIEIVP